MGLFTPQRYVASVDRIGLDELWNQGKRAILLDRDNTLVPRDARKAPPEVVAWLGRAREHGFELCMVSNNSHRSQVEASARELGMDAISFACKPLPFALTRALDRHGVGRAETVLVGDQLFTDVCAGNLAHIDTILVRPQSTTDLWYTKIFRIFERRALRDVACEE